MSELQADIGLERALEIAITELRRVRNRDASEGRVTESLITNEAILTIKPAFNLVRASS